MWKNGDAKSILYRKECSRYNGIDIHSIFNTVYNHFHIFADTSFIYEKFVCPDSCWVFFCLTEVYVCVCVRQQKQDTYNSIRFNTHCIFTYNVFAMLSLRLLASSPILLPPTFLNAVAVHFSFLFDAVVKHKRMKKCRKCHCIYKYNITM